MKFLQSLIVENQSLKEESSYASEFINASAAKENREDFVKLLNGWKSLAQKEHASYMRRNPKGDWYKTRTSLKATAKIISDKFQKLFAKKADADYTAIDSFDFTKFTPFQFWKMVTATELTEGWKVSSTNKDGVRKTFKNADDANAWRESSSPVSAKKQEKAEAKEAAEKLDAELYQMVIRAISNVFPDADPYEQFAPFLSKHNLGMNDVDRVMKRNEKCTYNKYIARMWDHYSKDEVNDAKQMVKDGKKPEDSVFYSVYNGVVTANRNPW